MNGASILSTGRCRLINGGSLFVFLLKAKALCLKEYPAFNSMIDHRKTTEFDTVDISIPIEITRDGEVENKQYLVKNADTSFPISADRRLRHSRSAA